VRAIAEQAELSIIRERAQWIALIQVDDGTPAAWEDLIRRSVPHIKGGIFLPRWEANSAFTPSSAMPGFHGFPDDLEAEWQVYRARWDAFLELNPRARIADMLSDCSESNDASSFPSGWEHVIKAWAEAGFPEPAPFYANNRIWSSTWRAQLLDAMQRAGAGWVYQNDDVNYEWRS
jgi:hypothetical protein